MQCLAVFVGLFGLVGSAHAGPGGTHPGGTHPGGTHPGGTHPDSVESELASFKTADGFVVNLFASEADGIINPINLRWDARGRLWVACSVVYPQLEPGQTPNDKVIVLEDTDRDGRADKSTVFADELNTPTGIELGGGGLYVGQGSELLHLRDTDDDGTADTREVLLSGFGNGDSHQTINSFTWSPGGELFFGQGDGIYSYVETPWGLTTLRQAGMWRLRPRRLQLDAFLYNFMGPGNPWGTVFDDWGQPLIVDGAGGITYLTPGLIPTHHFLKLRQIGSPGGYCGLDLLSGRHMPEEFRGDYVIADFQPNRISRFALRPSAAGFDVTFKPPLLHSSHRSFRPVDVQVGPDGAVYVSDWYNPVICHQEVSYRDARRDRSHGRIWRISAKGRAPVEWPELVDLPPAGLLEALKSPERWTRHQAKRLLADMDAAKVAKELKRWTASLDRDEAGHEHLLFEALGVYESIEVVETELLGRLLRAKDHRARAYATRVVGRWQDRLAKPLDLLTTQVSDPHPRVRMEAVIAAAHVPEAQAVRIATQVINHPMDRFLSYALTQAIHHLQPHWLPSFAKDELDFGDNVQQLAAVLKTVRSAAALPALRKLAATSQLDTDTRREILQTLVQIGDANDLRFALVPETYTRDTHYDAELHAEVLSDLRTAFRRRRTRPAGDLVEPLRSCLRHKDSQLKEAAIRLTGVWRVSALRNEILDVCEDADADFGLRTRAVGTLVRLDGPDARGALEKIAGGDGGPRLRLTAITALCEIDTAVAARHAAELLAGPQRFDPSEVFTAFLERRDGAEALATALSEVELSAETVERCMQTLSSAGRTDEALVRVLNEAGGVTSQLTEYAPEFIDQLAAETRSQGVAAEGELVFRSRKANCYSCHKIGGAGGWVGPDLSGIGTTMTLERIIEELLWPSRNVKEGFSLLQVITLDGGVYQGYEEKERDEDDKSGDLLLKDLVTGDERRIPLAQILARKEGGTAMPSGLTQGMSRNELRDLLRFLSELGAPGPFAVSQQPLIRRWETLTSVPAKFVTLDPNSKVEFHVDDADEIWELQYARISGVVELEDIVPDATADVLVVRTAVEVDRGGPCRLVLNNARGLHVWWNEQPIPVEKEILLDLEEGDHHLNFRVDLGARDGLGLLARWEEVDGSRAAIDHD